MLGQPKGRKRILRTDLRLSLAKQQAEELQYKNASHQTDISTGSRRETNSLIPLPALEISAQDDDDLFVQPSSSFPANEIQLFAIPIKSGSDQAWSQSAPDASVPFEIDEQLDDIVSSIENDLGALRSTSFHLSEDAANESAYRGGRRKEPRPPDMTDELRLIWEQERRRKDAHNDIEKRRREKIKDHIEELKALVPGSFDIGDQPNSTSEILEATVKYVQKLKNNQKQLSEVKDRVEQLQKMQRKLLLQKQMLQHLINVSNHSIVATQQVVNLPVQPTTAADSSMDYTTAVFNDVLLGESNNTLDCEISLVDLLT